MRRSIDSWLPTLNSVLSLAIRAIGAIGLVAEIFVDHFRNPTAIVVFGGIAGAPDVLGYAAATREALRREHEQRQPEGPR